MSDQTSFIDKLPTLTQDTVHTDRVGFEKAQVSLFRKDQADLVPMLRLRNDPHAQEKMPQLKETDDKGMMDWLIQQGDLRRRTQEEMTLAIRNETGNGVALCYLYTPDDQTLNRAFTQNLLPESVKNNLIIEISFGKDPSFTEHGFISSGLRSILYKIMEMEKLSQNSPDTLFIAYTKNNNESDNVLQAAGFTHIGNSDYETGEKEEDKNNKMWLLDRNRLLELIHKKSAQNMGYEYSNELAPKPATLDTSKID